MKLKVDFGLFSRTLVLSYFRDGVVQLTEQMGPDALRTLLRENRGLATAVSPELQAEARQRAQSFSWAAKAIRDEDLYEALPDWAREIVDEHGPAGREWVLTQARWLRQLLTGGPA